MFLKFYRAAGVLPYTYLVGNEPAFLLGREASFKSKGKLHFNILGGKREESDSNVYVTALREFWEESGSVLDHSALCSIRAGLDTTVLYFAQGKYAMFLYHMEHDIDLPERCELTFHVNVGN